MAKKRLSKSIRKFIRQEKARIRRVVFDVNGQEKQIGQLYERFFNNLKIEKNKNKVEVKNEN